MRVLLNVIIYSITIITFLPRVKAVFPLLPEKGGMSAGDSLRARSAPYESSPKGNIVKTTTAQTCFFLFRYSEKRVGKSAMFLQ